MSESPVKKKAKLTPQCKDLKRRYDDTENDNRKRIKNDIHDQQQDEETRIVSLKRKNFVTACEQVSYEQYSNYRLRFMLFTETDCLLGQCTHRHSKILKKSLPDYAEEAFKIEFKSHMWCDALDVCNMILTDEQFLSPTVLQDITELILNAQEDSNAGYTIPYLLDRSRQLLSLMYKMHPPCQENVRKYYRKFLTSPLEDKNNRFSNKKQFGSDEGIVKYCMTRLSNELEANSKDEPLIDKFENIPEDMKRSVKGLCWQKDTFEIFETLCRYERIDRLMIILESIIELLQLDLSIWNFLHSSNQGGHMMRSHKALMAYILWGNQKNILVTGTVTNNCRQILSLFINFIHLGFPKRHIDIMKVWFNTIVQSFYSLETNSGSDFPNIGKYCTNFANQFYKMLKNFPAETTIKVIQNIQPVFMRYLIGMQYLKDMLSTKEVDVLKLTIDFLRKSKWDLFLEAENQYYSFIDKKNPPKKKKLFKYLSKICKEACKTSQPEQDTPKVYPKCDNITDICDINQYDIVNILYLTFQAYLDMYSVQQVQDRVEKLNDAIREVDFDSDNQSINATQDYSYFVTEHFIKKYRCIYQLLKEIIQLFHQLKEDDRFVDPLKVFENVPLLGL